MNWWHDVSPSELDIEARALDTHYWLQTLRDLPALKQHFKERASKVIGADLFDALYHWQPKLKADPPDPAMAEWLRQVMSEQGFKDIRAKTSGDKELSAAAAIDLYIQLMRPRESNLKAIQAMKQATDKVDIAQNEELKAKARDAIKQAQVSLAEDMQPNLPDPGTPLDELDDQNLEQMIAQSQSSEVSDELEDGLSNALEDVQMAQSLSELMPNQGFGLGDSHETLKLMFNRDLVFRLGKQDQLRKILRLAGRMSQMLRAAKAEKLPPAPPPMGLTYSGNIADVVPSELAMLADTDLEPLFWKRYQEKSLLSYDRKPRKASGKGPMLICIDGSGSMSGQRLELAAACWIAFGSLALKEHRLMGRLWFASNATRVETLHDVKDLIDLETAGKHDIGYDTNLAKALDVATEFLDTTKSFHNADIIILTDGECAVSDYWLEGFKEWQRKTGTRLFGLHVGNGGSYWNNLKKTMLSAAVDITPSKIGELEWLKQIAPAIV